MIDACPSRDSVAGAPHVFERKEGVTFRVCGFCGMQEPETLRASRWWHCTGCGQTRFTHTVPKMQCINCPGGSWMPGKGTLEEALQEAVDSVPRNDQGMRRLCDRCKEHNIPRHAVAEREGEWVCQQHFDEARPWQLHDGDGNLLGQYFTLADLSTAIADKLRWCNDKSIVEDILEYRIKNKGEVTIEEGKLTCPLCGGHEFILLEGGYDRIDRVEFDAVNGKVIKADYQGFTEDGSGETMLSCINPRCVADAKFPIPEGIEVDYD